MVDSDVDSWDETTWIMLLMAPWQFLTYPFAMYTIYILNLHFKDPFFVKRHACLTWYIVIFAGIIVQIPRSIEEIYFLRYIHHQSAKGEMASLETKTGHLFLLCDMIHFSVWIGIFLLVSTKIWLYYWDINYRNAVLDKAWLQLLNPQLLIKNENNNHHSLHKSMKNLNSKENKLQWFLDHPKLGDVKYILQRKFPASFVFCVALCGCVWLQKFEIAFLLFITMMGFSFLFTIIMWYKIPKIYDNLYIRGELLRHGIAFGICFFGLGTFAIALIFDIMWFDVDNDSLNPWDIYWFPHLISLSGSWFILYNSVFYVTIKMNFTKKMEQEEEQSKLTSSIRYSMTANATTNGNNENGEASVASNTNTKSDATRESRILTKQKTVLQEARQWASIVHQKSAKHGYASFMRFLTKEFANENLLFITEYLTIRNVMEVYMPKHIKNQLKFFTRIEFPSDLPQSPQVECYTKGDCPSMHAFWYLFEKYIRSGSAQLEINISSQLRHNIEEAMLNKYNWKLLENEWYLRPNDVLTALDKRKHVSSSSNKSSVNNKIKKQLSKAKQRWQMLKNHSLSHAFDSKCTLCCEWDEMCKNGMKDGKLVPSIIKSHGKNSSKSGHGHNHNHSHNHNHNHNHNHSQNTLGVNNEHSRDITQSGQSSGGMASEMSKELKEDDESENSKDSKDSSGDNELPPSVNTIPLVLSNSSSNNYSGNNNNSNNSKRHSGNKMQSNLQQLATPVSTVSVTPIGGQIPLSPLSIAAEDEATVNNNNNNNNNDTIDIDDIVASPSLAGGVSRSSNTTSKRISSILLNGGIMTRMSTDRENEMSRVSVASATNTNTSTIVAITIVHDIGYQIIDKVQKRNKKLKQDNGNVNGNGNGNVNQHGSRRNSSSSGNATNNNYQQMVTPVPNNNDENKEESGNNELISESEWTTLESDMFLEMIPLFEACVSVLSSLLQSSYNRFKKTKEFKSLSKEVNIDRIQKENNKIKQQRRDSLSKSRNSGFSINVENGNGNNKGNKVSSNSVSIVPTLHSGAGSPASASSESQH